MKNYLLLGGTGAMGEHLCHILYGKKDANLFVTTRKDRKGSKGITYLKGNAHDIVFLNTVLKKEKWDAIIDFMNYHTLEFKERADILLESTKHYVFLSSARVYAESEMPITESSPRLLDVCTDSDYISTDDYSLAKARQEDVLLKSNYCNWTIIRPYITFSETRLQLTSLEKGDWLYRAIHGRSIVLPGDILEKKTTLTYGYDVSLGICEVLEQEKYSSSIINIVSDKSFKWKEILDLYNEVFKDFYKHSMKFVITDTWQNFYGGDLAQVKYDRSYNRVFDNSKIKAIAPNITFNTKEKLKSCLLEFLKNPSFASISWENEARKDRLTGEWTSLKEIPNYRRKISYFLIRIGLRK